MNYFLSIIASIVSGFLLWASFPPGGQAYFIWVSLIPLFFALRGKRIISAFTIAYICGLVFFFLHFNWINTVNKYQILHHFLLGFYLSIFFGVFGLVYAITEFRWNLPTALLAAPFSWISLEFIRSNFLFLSLPWGLISHSQYKHPIFIQSAAFAGVYGISFIIAAVNTTLLALGLLAWKHRNKRHDGGGIYHEKGLVIVVVFGLILFWVSVGYGYFKTTQRQLGNTINVAVTQGNIEQVRKWDKAYAEEIMQIYKDLTIRASKHAPDLIVWPESATPGSITRNRNIFEAVQQLVDSTGMNLMLGSAHLQKFNVKKKESAKYSNSVFLITPHINRKSIQRYDKIRLMPFGEYLPEKKRIPWDKISVPDIDEFLPGKAYTIFELANTKFAATICWENLFANHVRVFVKNGAQFIVNLTNEAWFGETSAPYQFLSMNVFRAVENGRYVVRSANTGISSVIDSCGRIVNRVQNKRGRDIFVRGFIVESICPITSTTFYTRWGDWLVWISMVISLVLITSGFIRENLAVRDEGKGN